MWQLTKKHFLFLTVADRLSPQNYSGSIILSTLFSSILSFADIWNKIYSFWQEGGGAHSENTPILPHDEPRQLLKAATKVSELQGRRPWVF